MGLMSPEKLQLSPGIKYLILKPSRLGGIQELLNWMKQTMDPALEALEHRNSSAALKKFMTEQDAKSGKKKKIKKKKNKKNPAK